MGDEGGETPARVHVKQGKSVVKSSGSFLNSGEKGAVEVFVRWKKKKENNQGGN